MLGEHGFIGLFLFVALMVSCFRSINQVWRWARANDRVAWAEPYCMMLHQGIVAFAASGAFLGLAYFDLYYCFVAASVLLKIIVKKELAEDSGSVGPEAEADGSESRAAAGVQIALPAPRD